MACAEEAYASAVIPVTDSHSSTSTDQKVCKRIKRFRNLNEDWQHDYSTFPGFLRENYRVIGPRWTNVPGDFRTTSAEHKALYPFVRKEEVHIKRIMESHDIHAGCINTRFYRNYNDTGNIDYISISTIDMFSSRSWLQAAQDIYTFCQPNFPNVNVEIYHRSVLSRPVTRILSLSDPCAQLWSDVESHLYHVLSTHPGVLAYRLASRGRATTLPEDDFSPTIMIRVKKEKLDSRSSPTVWKNVRDEVLMCLEQFPEYMRCAVLVYQADTELRSFFNQWERQRERFWKNEIYSGISLGRSVSDCAAASAGTFGCLLRLDMPDGRELIYGLTTCHVAMPLPGAARGGHNDTNLCDAITNSGDHPDQNSLISISPYQKRGFYDPNSVETLHVPSPKDIEEAIVIANEEITNWKGKLKKFFDSHGDEFLKTAERGEQEEAIRICGSELIYREYLRAQSGIEYHQDKLKEIDICKQRPGVRIVAASGRRCAANLSSEYTIVDWALLDIPPDRRDSVNEAPDRFSDHSSDRLGPRNRFCELPNYKPSHGPRVYKYGRTTSFGGGYVNNLRETQFIGNEWSADPPNTTTKRRRPDYAFVNIIETNGPDTKMDPNDRHWGYHIFDGYFSLPGDSGAAIYDEKHQFVGLLWGGPDSSENNLNGYSTYYTPADVLFADIAKVTGAKTVRLPTYEEQDKYQTWELR